MIVRNLSGWISLLAFFCIVNYSNGQVKLYPTLKKDEATILYRNQSVIIRFSVDDVLHELNYAKESGWYNSLDSAAKKKYDDVIKSIQNGTNNIDVTKGTDENLLINLFHEFIAADLLLKERALLWKRDPLGSIQEIKFIDGRLEKKKSLFYYAGNKKNPFISGFILDKPPTKEDLKGLNLAPNRFDSLMINIQESVIKNQEGNPKYPGGNDALLVFINQNFSCKGPTGVTTTVGVTIDSVGFIEKSSIKFNGPFPEKCKKDFIEVLLRSKQWQPAYSIVGNKNVSSGVLITLTF